MQCENPDQIRSVFNQNDQVQAQLDLHDLPDLTCAGRMGGGINSDLPWNDNDCMGLSPIKIKDEHGNSHIIGWAAAVIDCAEVLSNIEDEQLEFSDIGGVVINKWDPTGKTYEKLVVNFPDENDTRLIPVPNTSLDKGLYEFQIIMRNGRIFRHFEELTKTETVNADYADFVDVNIYPVPVTGKSFSADFDIPVPMKITMVVANNTGTPYYSKVLDYVNAGRNKHVVNMTSNWPDGTYFCVFQYPDGSTDSKQILIQNGD